MWYVVCHFITDNIDKTAFVYRVYFPTSVTVMLIAHVFCLCAILVS